MASDFSLTVDDRDLLRLVRQMSAKAGAAKAGLLEGRRLYADELLTDLKDHTPYDPEHTGEEPHARDGWELEQRGEDLAICNPVDHLYFLLHGNHANDPDGRIHATDASVLHFEAGGSEVFAMSVKPMEANTDLVEAWDRAEHSAGAFSRHVVEQVNRALLESGRL